jgi:hypothetical protein
MFLKKVLEIDNLRDFEVKDHIKDNLESEDL